MRPPACGTGHGRRSCRRAESGGSSTGTDVREPHVARGLLLAAGRALTLLTRMPLADAAVDVGDAVREVGMRRRPSGPPSLEPAHSTNPGSQQAAGIRSATRLLGPDGVLGLLLRRTQVPPGLLGPPLGLQGLVADRAADDLLHLALDLLTLGLSLLVRSHNRSPLPHIGTHVRPPCHPGTHSQTSSMTAALSQPRTT